MDQNFMKEHPVFVATAVGVGFGIGINAAVAFMPGFLRLFTENPQVIRDGIAYSEIVFLFSTALTAGVAFEKIFQAVGMMKVSMACMLLGCAVNIVLDPILIFGAGPLPSLGVRGAALATGLGQAASLMAYIIVFVRKPLPVRFRLSREVMREKVCRRIYLVGIPAALNIGLPSLLITALNGMLARFSQMYVLILGIYYKLQTFIYLTANGIVQGIRPLVGFNYGAGRGDRVKSILKVALGLGRRLWLWERFFAWCFRKCSWGCFPKILRQWPREQRLCGSSAAGLWLRRCWRRQLRLSC